MCHLYIPRHMIAEKNFVTNLKSCGTSHVTFGDRAKGRNIDKGQLQYSSLPTLDDVMLVKGLTTNLNSISQLCNQGLNVNVTKDKCVARNSEKILVMSGMCSFDNCYLWTPSNVSHSVCHVSKHDKAIVCHKQLEHVNLCYVKKSITKEAIIGIPNIIYLEEGQVCKGLSSWETDQDAPEESATFYYIRVFLNYFIWI